MAGKLDLSLVALNTEQVSVRLGPSNTGEAAWSASVNTRFSARVLESVRGEVAIYPGAGPTGAALWARSGAVGGDPWIVYVTSTGIGSFDGVHRNHTPAGWQVPRASTISMTTLNGLTVLNAPPNPPFNIIKGGGLATVIPGWPANTFCITMRGFRYYLVAGGVFGPLPGGESRVMWSDAAEPGTLPATWTPAPDNDAGDLLMADFPGPIVGAEVLGDVLLFYKFVGVFALAWVGGQAIMGRRVVFTNRGIINGQAIAARDREQVIATQGDLLVHDGGQIRSLIEGRFRRYYATRVQADRWEQVRMAHDTTRSEVWVAYPMSAGGPLVEAIVWCANDDTITVRELPPCRDIFYTPLIGARHKWSEMIFPWLQAGGREWSDISLGEDATGILGCLATPGASKFVQLDSGDVNAVTRTVNAERVGIGVRPYGQRKLYNRLRPRVEGEVGSVLQVQVGAHDEIGKPVKWGAVKPFVVGTDQSVPANSAGRFAAARFTGAGRWRIEGFELEYEGLGGF